MQKIVQRQINVIPSPGIATNEAIWAAASHFDLLAGNDLTQEFASCHTVREYHIK